jgi:heterodisulfide reductase subunit A-like polyferredoxin/coenzyme F420-reducing hydrogenase delta subunit
MAKKVGIFLCDCNRSLPLDVGAITRSLNLPTQPQLYSRLRLDDIHPLKYQAQKEKYDRLLIGCCGPRDFFLQELGTIGFQPEQIQFLNLKEECFWVHEGREAANGKAARLLRASLETAEARRQMPERPVKAGDLIFIAAESPLAFSLARRLANHAKVRLLLEESSEAFDSFLPSPLPCEVNRGRITEIQGHLGKFKVCIERAQSIDLDRCVSCMRCVPVCHTQAITAGLRLIDAKCDQCGDCLIECGEVRAIKIPRKDQQVVEADQVILFGSRELPPRHRRPGIHHVPVVRPEDIDQIAFDVMALIGDFMKPEFVKYNIGTCAGGYADFKGCGICIPACPYDAIQRDPAASPSRVKVDPVSCEACGACVSACPTSALQFAEPSPDYLYRRMRALLAPVNGGDTDRPVLAFHCSNQGRVALHNARASGVTLPANLLPVEVPCLRYVSEANMLAAFRMGAAGVALLGCEECPHGERQLLLEKLDFATVVLESFGFGGDRIRLFTTAEAAQGTLSGLGRFAAGLSPFPLKWDGQFPDKVENREVISDAISTFLYGTGKEPGRVRENTSFPFAWAEVRAEGCTMCRSCVNICPVHAFKLDDDKHTLEFRYMSCVACGMCEKACPENVITLRRDLILEKAAFAYQVKVQDEMVGCLQCGKEYINKRALAAIQAKVGTMEAFLEGRADLLLMCPNCRAVKAMIEVQKGWEP